MIVEVWRSDPLSNRIDSALGRQCGSVANFVKGTIAKIANLPQSLQSSHSPTTNLRIFKSQPSRHCERCLHRVAIHNQKADSSFKAMDRHALQSKARDDRESNNSTQAHRILGFAMRKPAKRCKAKPKQVSLANLCFASRVSEIRLEVYRARAAQRSKVYRAKPNPKDQTKQKE